MRHFCRKNLYSLRICVIRAGFSRAAPVWLPLDLARFVAEQKRQTLQTRGRP